MEGAAELKLDLFYQVSASPPSEVFQHTQQWPKTMLKIQLQRESWQGRAAAHNPKTPLSCPALWTTQERLPDEVLPGC